ncbi:MAG: hypothetical protein ACE5GT_05420 [Rhodospirillales bacterium]
MSPAIAKAKLMLALRQAGVSDVAVPVALEVTFLTMDLTHGPTLGKLRARLR